VPDFEARVVIGAGVVLAVWADPATIAAPSRINPNPTYQPKYVKVSPTATLVLRATVAGVDGPLDAALGGRLFQWSFVECAGPWPLSIVPTPGKSAEATIAMKATHFGHFSVLCRRDGGGGVVLHFDVEGP
jgi:hypothetical protein